MKKIYLLLATLLFITLLKAQNCDLQWTVKSNFYLSQFVTDSSGNSYAIGQKDSTQILITKYDAQGNVLWEKNQELTAGNKLLTIYTAIIARDSNLLLVGTYKNATNRSLYTMLYLNTGNLGWLKENDYTGWISDIVNVELKTTTLFITARSGAIKVVVLAYDLLGNLIMNNNYADSNPGTLSYIKSMTDDMNNIYIATKLTATDSTFINIRKYSVNGQFQWHTLNFKGIAYKANDNLDFFVTDAGTSYTVFNRKDPIKSDTLIITNYKTDGNLVFTHYQDWKKTIFNTSIVSYYKFSQLAIYGTEDTYLLYVLKDAFEQFPNSNFILYDKTGTIKWKPLTSGDYNFKFYDQTKHKLFCSGTYKYLNQNQETIYTSIFTVLNTITKEVNTLSGLYLSGAEFMFAGKNNVFWLNSDMPTTLQNLTL